ncbi:MAG: OsmC family protein [Cyclobacteriaceae bacterium]|nr:OsmC family protein [Cyclobacteriaceae bacterium]
MQFKSNYQGRLRTSIMHQGSGDTLLTDAPIDNKGQGETFSPTDLVAAALGSCIATIMGIEADKMNVNLNGLTWETTKEMQTHPRTIGKIKVHFSWKNCEISSKQRVLLKKKAWPAPSCWRSHPTSCKKLPSTFNPLEDKPITLGNLYRNANHDT